jgi:IPT/TIG domain-containing protein
MNSRRVVLCLGALSSALLVASAPASAATQAPVIKSISPMKLKVGEKLTVTGKYFLSGKGKTRVFFVRGKGGAAYAKSDSGSTTKLVVTLPAQLDKVLKGKATRIQIRVLAKKFGKLTAAGQSPLVSPSGDGGSGGGSGGNKTCMPNDKALDTNDSDKDGLNDALEVSLATDPCAADTDKDGVPDGFEYNSAQDLNSTVLFGKGPLQPYPGKKPYPNALNQDQDTDYDGDGMTLGDEYALWHKYGDGQLPLTSYSDGRQVTKVVTADPAKPWEDIDGNGILNDGEQDADSDNLGNWDEAHGRMTPEWWEAMFSGDNGLAKESPYATVTFPSTDMLDQDSNGDGVIDGLSDQDHDGLTNQFEVARPGDWVTAYVSTDQNYDAYDASTDTWSPGVDPYARVNPFNPCKPVYSQTCHLHPPFGAYKNEDWAFPYDLMPHLPDPGPTP